MLRVQIVQLLRVQIVQGSMLRVQGSMLRVQIVQCSRFNASRSNVQCSRFNCFAFKVQLLRVRMFACSNVQMFNCFAFKCSNVQGSIASRSRFNASRSNVQCSIASRSNVQCSRFNASRSRFNASRSLVHCSMHRTLSLSKCYRTIIPLVISIFPLTVTRATTATEGSAPRLMLVRVVSANDFCISNCPVML